MAIIQSILVGKGKGKIGNVVLSGLKGQTVAKQLNSSPSNPRTVAQTENRVKMANAVLAWQFLAQFFSYAKGIRKPLESVYNAFVRGVVSDMNSVLASSRAMAANFALSLGKFTGNWFNTTIDHVMDNAVVILLSSQGVDWSPSLHVSCILFNPLSGAQEVIDRPVTSVEFTAGTLEVLFPVEFSGSSAAAYLYDSAGSKITNVAFFG